MDKKANDLKKRLLESDLGKRANYSESYDPAQLFSVARDYTRDTFSYKDFSVMTSGIATNFLGSMKIMFHKPL
jgi:NADPH-dependent 7-cyano-7-deazaguanine reductase QueF-like protein